MTSIIQILPDDFLFLYFLILKVDHDVTHAPLQFFYINESIFLQEKEKEIKSPAPERLSCNGVEMIREYVSPQNIDDDYVYDVYFAEQVR